MNCRSVESLFSSYIEDEISQEERRNLEAHLMGCRRCSLAMSDVRATMSFLQRELPLVAPSAHFDEDVYARIRSGEGLNPSALDLIRELFSPAWLRPVTMAGARVCAVLAAVLLSPVGHGWMHPVPALVSASRTSVAQGPVAGIAVAPPASPVASATQTALPQGDSTPAPVAARSERGSVMASMPQAKPSERDSIVDGRIPRQRYTDEIINDQFYLERGPQGQDPSVVPVNETQDDGVYIVF